MTWLISERRQRRSTNAYNALRFQLEHTKERGGLEVLVLTDKEGIVLASAGDEALCEELGAVAPLMSRAPLGMRLPPLLRGGDVAVRPLRLHGQEVYLASLGGGVARDALLHNSIDGVSRIMTAN